MGDVYGVGTREPEDEELEFFKTAKGKLTPAYAADDDKIVVNPYFKTPDGRPLSDEELQGLKKNEASRVHMRNGSIDPPTFELTPEQKKAFESYGALPYQQQTIAARLLSNDKSALAPTKEQLKYVDKLREHLNKVEAKTKGGAVKMPEEYSEGNWKLI